MKFYFSTSDNYFQFAKSKTANWILKLFLLLPLFLLESQKLSAQLSNFHIERYDIDNGLSSNQIHCVYQDKKGYIWIGTQVGLMRFDGYEFKEYKHDDNDPSSIGKGAIWSICEDQYAQLWIGTLGGGLNLFNWNNESFLHYYKKKENGTSINDNNVNAITSDSLGNLWIGTGYGGLNCFDLKTKRFTYYKNRPDDTTSLSSDGIMAVLRDNKKNLWVGTWEGGLNLFNYKTKKFTSFKFDKDKSLNEVCNSVWTIYQDKKNSLWVGTWASGLLQFDPETKKFKRFLNNPKDNTSISFNVVLSILEDDKNNLWIGTENGLNLMNREKETFSIPAMTGKVAAENLYKASVYSLIKDKQGSIWMGTFGKGIYIWNKSKKFILHSLDGAMHGNWVTCVFEDENKDLWIGCAENGIMKYDRKLNNIENFRNENARFNIKFVSSICPLGNENLLFSTSRGLYQINKKSGSIKLFNNAKELSNTHIVNHKNKFIYLNINSGIVQLDISKNSFRNLFKLDPKLTIQCLIVSQDSSIWAGTDNGLFRFNMRDNSLSNFRNNSKSQFQIRDNNITTLYEDKNENIWIGTSLGLNKLNLKSSTLTVYTEKEGLSNSFINQIAEDDYGNIWISNYDGLSRLNIKSNAITNYNEADGLPDKSPGIFKISGNELVITGWRGFCIFNPEKISENNYIPPVIFTDFKLFTKSVIPGVKGSPLKNHISETKEIILSYKQSVITFNWVCFSYWSSENNQYAYKMEGFDKDWNYLGNTRTATYTNLNPGTYTFRVKASNNDGKWNETGASVRLIIKPPFWKTWWFLTASFVLIIVLIDVWHRWRTWNLISQKASLQKMVDERTDDLNKQKELLQDQKYDLETLTEELRAQSEVLHNTNNELTRLNSTKDRLFSIVAHDLKNPFNAIIGFSEILADKFDTLNEKKKRQMINYILESSKRAHNLLETLLEWARLQTNNIEFRPELINIKSVSEKVIDLFELHAASKNIKTNVKIADNLYAFADLAMIETILRNFISNAIKFTREGGKVTISATEIYTDEIQQKTLQNRLKKIKPSGNFIEISVTDTGIGMSEEKMQNIFRIDVSHVTVGTAGEKGTGLGLILCDEFAKKNQGKVSVSSSPEKGSTFSLYLPKSE